MYRQSIQFPAKDAALREDVHALGGLVGEVLRDQGGEQLFEFVEGDRLAAIARRDGAADGYSELLARVGGRDPELAKDLVRAFATWFQVVNLAEKVHRIRRRREYLSRSDRPQPGGIIDAFHRLKTAGLTADQVLELIGQLSIYPVLTAHPTESTRRTVMRKQQQMATLMMERLDPGQTPAERRSLWERLRLEVTAGWQTDEHPRERLTVADEREHVLFYLAEVIYRIVPAFHEEVEAAFEEVFAQPRGSIEVPCVLRCGSWVGGDMDGNDDVHAKSIRETLHRQQQVIVSTYYEECRALAQQLSQSASRIDVSRALQSRSDEYSMLLPGAQAPAPARHDRMPYRVFFGQMAERLRITFDGRPNHYEGAAQFLADLQLAADSLRNNAGRHAGLFPVERLIRRVRTFGFFLATLDVRQHASIHRSVVGQGLGDPQWVSRTPEERLARLRSALERDTGPTAPFDAVGRRTLAVFDAMLQGRARFGTRAVGDYVVSGASSVEDLLSVLLLARWAGATDAKTGEVPFDVVPLFETVTSLEHAGEVIRQAHAEPAYARHVASRGRRQAVMVGYTESNKESGITASRFAVYQSQAQLVTACQEVRASLALFHGRGDAASRGGGRVVTLVRSAPPLAVHGELRVTEQGEAINNSFGLAPIAMRTFEQAFHHLALATSAAEQLSRRPDDPAFLECMATAARASRARYRGLTHESPGFFEYFRAVTPVDVIERMQIGSRPAYREGRMALEALRAVPWVFAWTQSRHLLPGWFGLGTGLAAVAREHGADRLTRMWSDWSFCTTLIDDVELELAKVDLATAALYEALAPDGVAGFADEIRREYALARHWVTWLKGEVDLLDSDPRMQRSVLLRSPYLDPMHLMQVDLLRRWRAGGREDEGLFQALLASISGIAQGLQTTG